MCYMPAAKDVSNPNGEISDSSISTSPGFSPEDPEIFQDVPSLDLDSKGDFEVGVPVGPHRQQPR